jgi:N6-adenosine-specific RNA methylase IME4/ParB-like chromosome segregation protein Spo0J
MAPINLTRRQPQKLATHPQAERIPVMASREYEAFRADIAARGVQVPLEITAEGVVLDGRQRLCAALELGQEAVPVRVIEPEDELDYMYRAAIFRRELTASQRAALVVDRSEYLRLEAEARKRQRANLAQAAEGATLPPRGKTREHGAQMAGAGGRTVQDAVTVRKHDLELFERIKHGRISAALAARQVRRRLRDEALPPAPPLPQGPFDLTYADPPWQLGYPDSPHAPENHYATMELDPIKAIEVPAADDAVLFLWVVSSLLGEALEVVRAWGFECKTTICWVKPSIGLGKWVRNRHELLLVCRRGNYPPPDPEDCVDSVVEAPRGRHSEKPELFYELIERMYPQASKLELFARGAPRRGWSAWGNEVAP